MSNVINLFYKRKNFRILLKIFKKIIALLIWQSTVCFPIFSFAYNHKFLNLVKISTYSFSSKCVCLTRAQNCSIGRSSGVLKWLIFLFTNSILFVENRSLFSFILYEVAKSDKRGTQISGFFMNGTERFCSFHWLTQRNLLRLDGRKMTSYHRIDKLPCQTRSLQTNV